MLDDPSERQSLTSAFLSGVFMGLAAPALLLTTLAARREPAAADSFAGAWTALGDDMRRVVARFWRERRKAI